MSEQSCSFLSKDFDFAAKRRSETAREGALETFERSCFYTAYAHSTRAA